MATSTKKDGDNDRTRDFNRAVKDTSDRSVDIVTDMGRLMQAWTVANTELLTGYTRVMGSLVTDMSDNLTRDRRRDNDDEESTAYCATSADISRDLTRTVTKAMEDNAKNISKAFDRFSEVYNEKTEEAPKSKTAQTAKA